MRSDVMIFDGVCHLCARSVKFILDHESEPTLRFVPLQSPAGARMMRELGLSAEDAKTFALVVDGHPYVKSEAAIRVARYLEGPWRLLGGIRMFPRAFRDWGYNVVARNRYRWFGRGLVHRSDAGATRTFHPRVAAGVRSDRHSL